MPKKLSATDEAAITVAYTGGTASTVLGKQYNCSNGLIRQAVRRQGGKLRDGRGGLPREWSDEERDLIVADAKAGIYIRYIARKYHATYKQIHRVLANAGISNGRGPLCGPRHHSWKGGKYTHGGYVRINIYRGHPQYNLVGKVGFIFEHRLVMAQMLGRTLLRNETVHHKNGIHDDNRPANLELWYYQPKGQRISDLLDYIVIYHRVVLEQKLKGV